MTAVLDWTLRNGFKISSSKTKAVHFRWRQLMVPSPTVKINGNNIEYRESSKFLGIIFDSKLTFQEHLRDLKAKCQKAMGLLKSLTSTEWGADQHMIMHLYRALIRSKLEHGQIVYGSASDSNLRELDAIPNEAIRIATGAFKSSPISTMQVLVNERPLQIRRELSSLKYFFKELCHKINGSGRAANVICSKNFHSSPLLIDAGD